MQEVFHWGNDKLKRTELIFKLAESHKQSDITKLLAPEVSQGTISNTLNGKSSTKKYISPPKIEYSDVETIFGDIETYANMVISGYKQGLLITGMSGMGKTYTIQEALKKHDKIKGEDFKTIKGKISPLGLYIILYANRDSLLIFDDSDSVWDNDDSLNILKHALDSNENTISWISSKEIKNPLYKEGSDEPQFIPNEFDFNGSIIFISNRFKHELNSAVLTRTPKVDLNLTIEDTIKRIEQLLSTIQPNIGIKKKKQALDFLKYVSENNDICDVDISLRSYIDVLDLLLFGSSNWERLAYQQCIR